MQKKYEDVDYVEIQGTFVTYAVLKYKYCV